MTKHLLQALTAAGGLVVGLALAHPWGGVEPRPEALAPTTPAHREARPAPVDPAALREIVRSELARMPAPSVMSATTCSAPAVSTSPAAVERTHAPDREAWAEASELLDSAVAEGVWSDEAALAFHARLSRLAPSEATSLTVALVNAVNDGRLDVTGLSFVL